MEIREVVAMLEEMETKSNSFNEVLNAAKKNKISYEKLIRMLNTNVYQICHSACKNHCETSQKEFMSHIKSEGKAVKFEGY